MDSFGLTTLLVATAVISHICFHRPNPPPAEPNEQDLIVKFGYVADFRENGFLILSILHLLITITFPSPPKLICPNPDLLNPTLFTWSTYTTTLSVLICIAGIVRIIAFRHLDKNFTFELAPPTELVTTGIYGYLQHPSYLPDGILTVTNAALFANLDGWPSCILPAQLVELLLPFRNLVFMTLAFIWTMFIWHRIHAEEAMLKATFGKQWTTWHSKTARFIPFIF